MRVWRCRCDCGVEITVPRVRLPYYPSIHPSQIVDACPACRLGIECVVCGEPFVPLSSRALTCSLLCRGEHRTANLKAARERREAADPEAVKTAHAKHRARVAADPARYAKKIAGQRAWWAVNAAEGNERRKRDRVVHPEKYRAHVRGSRGRARLAQAIRIGAELDDKL